MIWNVNIASGAARIVMPNLFNFTMYHGFMKSCTPLLNNTAIHKIEIELSNVDSLDSFELDMLMLLKERAAAANKSVSLLGYSVPASRLLGPHFCEMFGVRGAVDSKLNDFVN